MNLALRDVALHAEQLVAEHQPAAGAVGAHAALGQYGQDAFGPAGAAGVGAGRSTPHRISIAASMLMAGDQRESSPKPRTSRRVSTKKLRT